MCMDFLVWGTMYAGPLQTLPTNLYTCLYLDHYCIGRQSIEEMVLKINFEIVTYFEILLSKTCVICI